MSLVVVGDVNIHDILESAEKYFATDSKTFVPAPTIKMQDQACGQFSSINPNDTEIWQAFAWPTPAANDFAGCATADVLMTMLTTGNTALINKWFSDAKITVISAGGEYITSNYPGRLIIWIHTSKKDAEIAKKQIRLTTERGDIVFELYNETAPLTVSNFVYLSNEGYFNGLKFHRREEGFVIQGGDPSGNGTGGPGYKFADELNDKYTYERGTVAMANAGPNTNGSQFFIMLGNVPLPKAYTIFGKVTSGMEVVDKIKVGDKMTTVTVEDKK
jgi:peptidyl-prolyl cis-trans isomerase B (cyclophilin B)